MIVLRQAFEAARQGGLRAFSQRVLWLAVLAGCLLGIVGLVLPERAAREVTGIDLFGIIASTLLMQVGLPLIAVYLGQATVHSDISDRSVTHIFVRPVSRVTLLLGRFVAVSAVSALSTALVLGVVWTSFALPDHAWRHGLGVGSEVLISYVLAACMGAPAYVAAGMFCGATFRRPLVAGVLFVVAWEGFASYLPPQAGVRAWTVADPLRRFLLSRLDVQADDGLGGLLVNTAVGFDLTTLPHPLVSVAWFSGIALVGAIAVATTREYDSRPRD